MFKLTMRENDDDDENDTLDEIDTLLHKQFLSKTVSEDIFDEHQDQKKLIQNNDNLYQDNDNNIHLSYGKLHTIARQDKPIYYGHVATKKYTDNKHVLSRRKKYIGTIYKCNGRILRRKKTFEY